MYNIEVESNFSSAHNLRGYRGKCEELHGHNWKVRISIKGKEVDKTGMVYDFKYVKKQLDCLLEPLDHCYLNRINFFKKINPTSENIARYIYQKLKKKLKKIYSVTVWESDRCSATYYEE